MICNKYGSIEVLTPSGEPSLLYAQLSERYDAKDALRMYLFTKTSEFKDSFGDWVNDAFIVKEKLDKNGEPLIKYVDEASYQLTPEEQTRYLGQKMNEKQKAIINDILGAQQNMDLVENPDGTSYYVNKSTGDKFTRVTEFLFGKMKKQLHPAYGIQGSAYHKMVEDVIAGKETGIIAREIPKWNNDPEAAFIVPTLGAYEFIEWWRAKHNLLRKQGWVFLPEMIISSKKAGIAGRTDILGVKPDGSIAIFDLKTGKNSTLEDTYELGKFTVEDGYFAGKQLSTKDKHAAQVTTYARMIEEMGHTISDMTILPYHLVRDENMVIQNGRIEPEVDLKYNTELAHSLIPSVAGKKIEVDKPSTIKFTLKTLEDVKIFLEKRLQRANHIQDKVKRDQASKQIKKLQYEIQQVDDALAVAKFIELAKEELVGFDDKKGRATLFDEKVVEVKKNLKDGIIDSSEALRTLDEFRVYAEGFHVLDNIFDSLTDMNFADKKDDSAMKQLQDARAAKQHIINEYNNIVDDIAAEWLDEVKSDKLNEVAMKEIAKLDESIKVATKHHGADSARVKSLEARKLKYKDSFADKDSIRESLRVIREDVGLTDMWLNATISSSNKVLALFAKQVKKTLEGVREYIRKFQFEIHAQYQEYAKSKGGSKLNAAEFNKGLYEKRSVLTITYDENGDAQENWSYVGAFVERTDFNKYNEAKAAMYKAANAMDKDKKGKFISDWYATNHQPKSKAAIDEIIADMKATLDPASFNKWVKKNLNSGEAYQIYMTGLNPENIEEKTREYANKVLEIHNYGGQITYKRNLTEPNIVKYYNQAYAPFEETAAETPIKKYYKYLTGTYLAAQQRLPTFNRRGMILPSVPKNNSDRILEQGLKGAGTIVKESLNYSAEDEATMEYRTLDDNDRSVPIKYTSNMNYDDVSLDLVSSIALFEESSSKYYEISKILPHVNAVQTLVSSAEVQKTNSKGQSIVDATAKKLGIHDKYVKKHGTNLAAAQLESFIDMQIYGALSEKETWGKVDTGKVADSLITFTANSKIAWDALKPVANALQANVMLAVEGFAREFVTKTSLAKAQGDYLLAQGAFMSDMTKPFNQSLEGQMVDYFDAIQGKFKDEYGRTLSWSAAKMAAQSKAGFFLMNLGEHEVQTKFLFAMMRDTKLLHGNKEISLKDAMELDEKGIIRVKEGVTKLDGTPWTEKDRFDFMNKLHAINKRMHGIYNNFDRIHLKRYAVGRLMMLFRNFLVPAIKRRYKGLSGDQELGAHTEGFYMTFFNTIGRDLWNLRMDTIKNWSSLSDMEKANIRRFISEMGFILLFAALTVALSAAADGTDDDDFSGYMIHYALYQTTRVRKELFAYLNPADAIAILRSPSAVTTSIEQLMKIAYYIGIDPLDGEMARYERKSGKHKKGDLKLAAEFQKLFGLSGMNMNPEEAVKVLNFSR